MVKDKNGDEWVTPKEAAIELNLSVSRVYHIKNFLTHKKRGENGPVFFLKRTLFEDYMNML